jgi:hypothetical protein
MAEAPPNTTTELPRLSVAPAAKMWRAADLPFSKTRSPVVSTTWEMGYNVEELRGMLTCSCLYTIISVHIPGDAATAKRRYKHSARDGAINY